jgi:hypothetical protein
MSCTVVGDLAVGHEAIPKRELPSADCKGTQTQLDPAVLVCFGSVLSDAETIQTGSRVRQPSVIFVAKFKRTTHRTHAVVISLLGLPTLGCSDLNELRIFDRQKLPLQRSTACPLLLPGWRSPFHCS